MKPRVIRLWAPAILLAGIAVASSSVRLDAQSSPSALKTGQSATKSLLDKARDLENHGRLDLAVQAWQQVLLAEPRNTEALGNLARACKLEGDPKLANSYLEQLRKISPNDPSIARVEQAEVPQSQKPKLQEAARLSDAGKYAAAMAIYRQLFGSHPPAGDLAVAYYETESATDGSRPQAVEGLRALVEKYPSDPRYQISLGRVLTYDPATRQEGRKYFEKFPNDLKATQGVRQSLLWDAANPDVAPQIRAYLAAHQDPQLAAVFQMTQPAQKAGASSPAPATALSGPPVAPAVAPPLAPTTIAAVSPAPTVPAANPIAPAPGKSDATKPAPAPADQAPGQGPSDPPVPTPSATKASFSPPAAAQTPSHASASGATTEGSATHPRGTAAEVAAYQALNANHVEEAETRFNAILAADPNNPKALAGMGYVRMQQGNFLGAISFLEQAKQGDPEDKGVLAALDTARFWFIMGEGQNALNSNDLTTAEKRYRAALDLRPTNVEALEGLGGTLLKAQQPAPALPLFERAVAAQPASAEGWRGLFLAQFQSNNAALALTTVKRIPQPQLAELMKDPRFLQALASAYAAVGRGDEAQARLEVALQYVPPDEKALRAEIQSQLAGILSSANHLDQAAAIYKQLVAADPGNVAAWQGLVRVQHAMGHDEEALQTVEGMPAASYAAAMRDTAFDITVASIFEAQKKPDAAQDLLQKAVTEQTNAGQKPSPAIQMQLAGIYLELGSPQLAYPLYQQVIRENPDRADAWAGLLSALHATGHDQEVVAQIKLIPPGVRSRLETNPSYLQTMAAVYGALGRSREATQFLGRVEQDYAAQRSAPPASLEIQNAWLLYNGMDDAGLYRQLMSLGGRTDLTGDQRRAVQTIWTNWAARRANQAAAVGNPRRAVAILNAAAQAFPDNPAAIKSLAAGYAQAGQPHQAVLIYKAQNMSSASVTDYGAAVSAALADGDNKDAEIWLRYALAAYPADPQILILAARFEQERGDTAKAIKYYGASLKAMPPASPVSKLAAELGLPTPTTPGSLPSADKPESLSVLLAPENLDTTPAVAPGQPYLPSYDNQAPLPPYDGTSKLVPAYMTNPNGAGGGKSANPAPGKAEVESTVQSAASRTLSQPEPTQPANQPQAATASPAAANEVYRPYVPYVAPPPTVSTAPAAVTVQLGDNTPRPMQPQTDETDVLPTARYAQSARANRAAASHDAVAAARAERIRRLQEDAAARTGQSHPPPEETITGTAESTEYTAGQSGAQVRQPSTPPGRQIGNVPDTGAQQYPQPNTPPRPSGQTTVTRNRPAAPTTPPAAVSVPVAVQPAPASAVATTPPPALPDVAQPLPRIGPTYPLAPPPTDAELRAKNLPPLGGDFEGQVTIPMTQRQQAETELDALEGSYSSWVGATGIGRYRAGTIGLDRLYDVESPVEASAVISQKARLTVVALPVFLNSGVLNSASFTSGYVPYLGTMPANTAAVPAQQFSNGIGGELQLTTKNIGLAVGYTPYEFLVRNMTGRIRWSTLGGHVTVYGDRQPVKDTQLSYAGLYDPGASTSLSQGPIWGGVIATGGGVRLDFSSGNTGFYVSGDGASLTGRHVLDNTRYGGTIGATFRVGNWRDTGSLVVGGALTGMHYEYNEVGLSYGQGGYFSPNSYFLASVPVSFDGHYKANFHYSIAGALGVQTFEQGAAPFYPLDPLLQSGFTPSNGVTCSASQAPSYNCGEYPLIDTTAFNYSINSEVSYRFAEHWYGGGFVFANNSNNFNDVAAGFFFRYVFRAQHSPEGYPAGLFRVDGLRPLQIP
jgi:tetratricopeptide (TPR) repeat protein